MAWNHDSKRQVYLSTDLSPFNIFPNHIEDCPPMPTGLVATKKNKPKGSDRIFGHLDLWWITQDLTIDNAKFAKLIFYPQYPEVRLSGFVRGTKSIPSRFLREKSGETYENRLLFLGTDRTTRTYAFLAVGHTRLRNQVRNESGYEIDAGLNRIELQNDSTSEKRLLTTLSDIHRSGWHEGKRLKKGVTIPYNAPNAVGYTLEALMGIEPNGYNAPDYEGFEIKALTSTKLNWSSKKVVTVMTPEPDIGAYCKSIRAFLEKYGYPDQRGRTDRRNFGGIYKVGGKRHSLTGLILGLTGYSLSDPDHIEPNGRLQLTDEMMEIAAGWSFRKLLEIWTRKHEAAVYVPAISRREPNQQFRYLDQVLICEGADFFRVLRCFLDGDLYLDPSVKAEGWESSTTKIKKRNQFRIKLCSIPKLYKSSKIVSLLPY